jgi:hypothetical protein
LVTWAVAALTAAKFKPLTASVLGFTLSYIVNVWIMMTLNGFYFTAGIIQ